MLDSIASIRCRVAVCLIAGLLAFPAQAQAANAGAGSASGLAAKYAELRGELSASHFQKPIFLTSGESRDSVAGDMYALIDQPFATAAGALSGPGNWCDILILHLNTKYCRASTSAQGSVLSVSIGKKYDQPLEQAHQVVFVYRVTAQTRDYLQVRLTADQGPLSTRDYQIMLEAVAVDNGRTFVHLSYAYGFGLMGRLSMQIYLGTVGSNKVGFTVVGTEPNGTPRHIGGMRGVVERNTMRYYLAIEAFLGALSTPPQARLEKRLRDWFAAIERYPRQLHEMEEGEYLEMKRKEHLRQQAWLPQPSTLLQETANVQAAGTGG